MQLSWSHSVIRVRDLELMVGFYREVLGFSESDRGALAPVDGAPKIVFLSGRSTDHHQIAFVTTRGEEQASSLEHMAFRVASITEVREMLRRVSEDDRVGDATPITHGNAISVYFSDPEGNGIEVFCDTPWHTKQPVIQGWDPAMSDEEVLADIEQKFCDTPEFGPMEGYRARRAAEFGEP